MKNVLKVKTNSFVFSYYIGINKITVYIYFKLIVLKRMTFWSTLFKFKKISQFHQIYQFGNYGSPNSDLQIIKY